MGPFHWMCRSCKHCRFHNSRSAAWWRVKRFLETGGPKQMVRSSEKASGEKNGFVHFLTKTPLHRGTATITPLVTLSWESSYPLPLLNRGFVCENSHLNAPPAACVRKRIPGNKTPLKRVKGVRHFLLRKTQRGLELLEPYEVVFC